MANKLHRCDNFLHIYDTSQDTFFWIVPLVLPLTFDVHVLYVKMPGKGVWTGLRSRDCSMHSGYWLLTIAGTRH